MRGVNLSARRSLHWRLQGDVAEWLGSGLQSRPHQFDSGRRLLPLNQRNARGRNLSHRRGSFPLTATPGVRTHRTRSPAALLPLAVAILISLLLAARGSAGYAPEPRPIGVGDRFTLTAAAVESAALPCGTPAAPPFGVHLELFVDAWVVLVPSGIGVRQPWVGTVPYVESGACEHPIVTREPTGVIEVAGPGHTLGDLFALWGQPLGP